MKRTSMGILSQWLGESNRQPLVMRGARQVGKTWLVRELAKQHGLRLVEINFERAGSEVTGMFRAKDPRAVVRGLELMTGHGIDPGSTLLFLDEIQAMPEVLANLRWFAEELPTLPVIAAGSLLDFVLAEHTFSMPVGRIAYHHLEPMTFVEFLEAAGEAQLLLETTRWTPDAGMHPVAHARLSECYRDYLVVGGMPAVVHRWIDGRSMLECAQIQHSLLGTFRDDFSKYSRRVPVAQIGRVMEAIPRMAGRIFKYSRVADGERSAAIRQTLELLCRAQLATRVQAASGMGLPLGGNIRERIFKVIFLDSGLMCAALGLTLERSADLSRLVLVNEGGLAEQAVGQCLRASLPHFAERALYFWSSERNGAVAEVDYLLQHGTRIVPIEVKAGTTGSLKSLHHFMARRDLQLAVRVNADLPSVTDVDIKTTEGERVRYRLLSIPFYLADQMPRVLGQA
jgi:predicted AAA+ superfamily ATPase